MQGLYKAIELSKSQTVDTYEVMDESLFIPALTEWGLFDEDGSPNMYQADEKYTNKLAMVRVARFFRYEFDLDEGNYGALMESSADGANYFELLASGKA
jgi:hypothetical protein